MGDSYYGYTNPMLQQQQQPPPATAATTAASASASAVSSVSFASKRPRPDFDASPGQDMSGYYSREDDRAPQRQMTDADSINQLYNYYLHSGQNPYQGMESGRLHSSSHPVDDSRMVSDSRFGNDPRFMNDPRMGNVMNPDMSVKGHGPDLGSRMAEGNDPRFLNDPLMGNVMNPGMSVKGHGPNLGSGMAEVPLPSDASSTIYVEGLPPNCTRREVAHIFRPFAGYREVRLVTKESRRPGGDPLVLCFVDFMSPSHATTALNSINGYLFDETDRVSAPLRLQYARFPGARSGGGRRGRH